MKRNLLVVLFILLGLYCSSQISRLPSKKPLLVVGIVVDNMRYDYIQKFSKYFESNGFNRLLNNGAYCKNVRYNYLLSQTSTDIASIYTGCNPSIHGIVSDVWYDDLKSKKIKVIEDKKVYNAAFKSPDQQYSPKNLLCNTLSDELKLAYKKSKSISIALKPKSAIISSGKSGNNAFWYDSKNGKFTTSTYYVDSLPNWVNQFNNKEFAKFYLSKDWNPINKEKTISYAHDNNLNNVSFKHAGKKKNIDYKSIKNTPYVNYLIKDFAISAIESEELGKDENPDILSIQFNSLNENYTENSLEMFDTYMRLDKDIAHLLDYLEEKIGKNKVLVFLTASNSRMRSVKELKKHKLNTGFHSAFNAVSLLKSYLNITYGAGEWIVYFDSQQIYLNKNLIEDSKLSLSEIQDKAAEFLIQFKGIADAIPAHKLLNNYFSGGVMLKAQKTFNANRSGDVLLNLAPGWRSKDFDRQMYNRPARVPLIWYGWLVNRSVNINSIDVSSIVPTLSLFLDINVPEGCFSNPILNIKK